MGLIGPFDFRNLNWNKVQSASSPGMLAKANINLNNKLYFLKLGSYNIAYGFYGNVLDGRPCDTSLSSKYRVYNEI